MKASLKEMGRETQLACYISPFHFFEAYMTTPITRSVHNKDAKETKIKKMRCDRCAPIDTADAIDAIDAMDVTDTIEMR